MTLAARHRLAEGSSYQVITLTFGRARIVVSNGVTYERTHW